MKTSNLRLFWQLTKSILGVALLLTISNSRSLALPTSQEDSKANEIVETNSPITITKAGETTLALVFSPSSTYTGTFLDLIRQAKSEIQIAMFNMDCKDVLEELKQASKRGVKIEIALDNNERKKDLVYTSYIENLKRFATVHIIETAILQEITDARETAGIESWQNPPKQNPENIKKPTVRFTSYVAMHHKFMVVDKQAVWTGSGNASTRAFDLNDEAALLINNKEVAKAFYDEFQWIVNTPQNDIWKKNLVTSISLEDGNNMDILMLPAKQSAVKYICDLLDTAKEEVIILMSEITSKAIRRKLVELHDKGIKVSLLTNKYKSESRDSEVKRLGREGINVVYSNNNYTMHQRCVVIDGKRLLVSSGNFSARGLEANIENMIVLENKELAAAQKAEFERCSSAIPYIQSKWGTTEE